MCIRDRSSNFSDTTWTGYPIWQNVLDLWIIQETISEIKPSLLIECGTNRGGSARFFGQLFDLLGQGEVISVDIEKMHEVEHPRVKFLLGSSTSEEIFSQMKQAAEAAAGPVLVILDSDHTKAHVAKELEMYTPLVSVGSYCLVQDLSLIHI